MEFTFTEALRRLNPPDDPFTMMNTARPATNYLWSRFLPERPRPTYEVKSGDMTVRSAMAGLSGMDSPYPPTGIAAISTFLEQSAKIANSARLSEEALRTLQLLMQQLMLAGGSTAEALADEILNFTNALIVQPHLDTLEWLRGQAIATGGIDWTFNKKRLLVDYGVPTANKLTPRTGNDGYGGSASKFWTDVRSIRRLLRYNLDAIVAHPDTIDMITLNAANALQVVNQTNSGVTVQAFKTVGGNSVPSGDARDTVEIIAYGLESEVIDPANPDSTITVPFCPRGKLVGVGKNVGTQYVVGAGSQPPVDRQLGYTHVAPTVEGGGRPGRWARVYTPEREPWALVGEGVQNALPVIEAPDKIVIATTDMV